MRLTTGLDAIHEMFATADAQGRAAFLPYFTMGFPNYETSLEIIVAMSEAGVDGFEVGIPFSDPLADGPTIQMSSQIALEQGMNVHKALEAVRTLRSRGVMQPMFMFSYLNPIMAYGLEAFVIAAKEAGADGFIIPDLPPEEAGMLAPYCQQHNMAMVFFLAPTSNEKRIAVASEQASGFIYVLSVTGITGARTELPQNLTDFINRVRRQTDKRLVLGFGISTPEQAYSMNGLVDGFIVGSALVKAAHANGVEGVRQLVSELRNALND
ncbi:MAG: tryptophan synthase subunit alpha [Phototrophicaceae bacterium]